jgi:hypothetical protein
MNRSYVFQNELDQGAASEGWNQGDPTILISGGWLGWSAAMTASAILATIEGTVRARFFHGFPSGLPWSNPSAGLGVMNLEGALRLNSYIRMEERPDVAKAIDLRAKVLSEHARVGLYIPATARQDVPSASNLDWWAPLRQIVEYGALERIDALWMAVYSPREYAPGKPFWERGRTQILAAHEYATSLTRAAGREGEIQIIAGFAWEQGGRDGDPLIDPAGVAQTIDWAKAAGYSACHIWSGAPVLAATGERVADRALLVDQARPVGVPG